METTQNWFRPNPWRNKFKAFDLKARSAWPYTRDTDKHSSLHLWGRDQEVLILWSHLCVHLAEAELEARGGAGMTLVEVAHTLGRQSAVGEVCTNLDQLMKKPGNVSTLHCFIVHGQETWKETSVQAGYRSQSRNTLLCNIYVFNTPNCKYFRVVHLPGARHDGLPC